MPDHEKRDAEQDPGTKRLPPLAPLDEYVSDLCRMVAQTSWLPNRETVAALSGPAFPTARARRDKPRLSPIKDISGKTIGMYDDNMTPAWALMWAHGFNGQKCSGWTLAHVWQMADDINCYTNLSNLILVPECFASLTDKNGPLTSYLQWHSMQVYDWAPRNFARPSQAPVGYQKIEWRYFDFQNDPKQLIRNCVGKFSNQRVNILRNLI